LFYRIRRTTLLFISCYLDIAYRFRKITIGCFIELEGRLYFLSLVTQLNIK